MATFFFFSFFTGEKKISIRKIQYNVYTGGACTSVCEQKSKTKNVNNVSTRHIKQSILNNKKKIIEPKEHSNMNIYRLSIRVFVNKQRRKLKSQPLFLGVNVRIYVFTAYYWIGKIQVDLKHASVC